MDDNQPNPASGADPEWEAIQKKTPGLKEEQEPIAQKAADEAKAKEAADKKVADDAKAQADADAAKATADAKGEEVETPAKPTRPEKYIPVKKYTDEKNAWKESDQKKDQRIAELETIAGGKADTVKNDTAIQKYAEKHDLTFDEAKEQVEDLRSILGVESKPAPKVEKPELTEEQRAKIAKADLLEAQEEFSKEFSADALPTLKMLFPDATPEQLAEAKKELEKISCTSKFVDKPLDSVVLKSKAELAAIFASKKTSPEVTRQGASKTTPDVTAQDFKDGKISFEDLSRLSPEQQNNIVEMMDIPTYDKYLKDMNRNDKLVINRGGRSVKF